MKRVGCLFVSKAITRLVFITAWLNPVCLQEGDNAQDGDFESRARTSRYSTAEQSTDQRRYRFLDIENERKLALQPQPVIYAHYLRSAWYARVARHGKRSW